ncbi:unnamed protein product [Musa banksii]
MTTMTEKGYCDSTSLCKLLILLVSKLQTLRHSFIMNCSELHDNYFTYAVLTDELDCFWYSFSLYIMIIHENGCLKACRINTAKSIRLSSNSSYRLINFLIFDFATASNIWRLLHIAVVTSEEMEVTICCCVVCCMIIYSLKNCALKGVEVSKCSNVQRATDQNIHQML